MKHYVRLSIVTGLLFLLSNSSFSQDQSSNKIPKWVSEAGYWVVESNIKTPLNHIIWFYNNDHILVYKETVTGIRLNPSRKAVKMKLKKVLETSITAWQEKNEPQENKELVAAILK
jgi:hypothetical protein